MKNNNYEAGKCNIGDNDVKRRKYILVIAALAMIFVSVYIIFISQAPLLILLLLMIACGTFLNYYQVTNRFCVMHGITHTAKFSDHETEKIKDLNFIKKDFKMVNEMLVKSILLAVGFTFIVYLTASFIK